MNEGVDAFALLVWVPALVARTEEHALVVAKATQHFARCANSTRRWDYHSLCFAMFVRSGSSCGGPSILPSATMATTVVAEDLAGQYGGFASATFGSDDCVVSFAKDVLGARSLLVSLLCDGAVLAATTTTAIPALSPNPWLECPAAGAVLRVIQSTETLQMSLETRAAPSDALAAWLGGPRSEALLAPAQLVAAAAVPDSGLVDAAAAVVTQLENSVRRTVLPLLRDTDNHITVLFSGGLDSTFLSAVISRVLPQSISIVLVNVAFLSSTTTTTKPSSASSTPDRVAGLASLADLQCAFPNRNWIFRAIDVPETEARAALPAVVLALHPADTFMDATIGLSLWFACRGRSSSNIVVLGQGADELFGGYARYRGAFQRASWGGLQREMDKDFSRLWLRNLGRDDRLLRECGAVPALPFLDRDFCKFVLSQPLWRVCDMRLPPGTGDKQLLRIAARSLGLHSCSILAKRAIQFGSRCAKFIRPEGLSAKKRSAGGSAKLRLEDDTDDD